MGNVNYRNGFDITLHENMLSRPLTWKKPRLVFVNSMSDLFHEKVPLGFIKEVFSVMKKASWHTFQILTKRADRLSSLASALDWAPNIWMGVTIESDQYLERLDFLRSVPSAVRFLSCEPLLSSMETLELNNIDWVITGGESGPGSRPMDKAWVELIQKKCLKNQVPFFFKQWGGSNKKKAGSLLNGKNYFEMPGFYQ
jgi:protein gp37